MLQIRSGKCLLRLEKALYQIGAVLLARNKIHHKQKKPRVEPSADSTWLKTCFGSDSEEDRSGSAAAMYICCPAFTPSIGTSHICNNLKGHLRQLELGYNQTCIVWHCCRPIHACFSEIHICKPFVPTLLHAHDDSFTDARHVQVWKCPPVHSGSLSRSF
jgi:hypothetical protein